MAETIIYILIGTFIGWNFPQPWWALWFQEKVSNFFRKDR